MIRKADKSGKLSPEQVKELARVFKENHLAELPAKLGGKLRANPKKISVAFGKKEVQFVMQGGGRLPKVDPKQAKRSANDRFILIATAIKQMLKPKKAD
jgi:hypothetical protein